MRALGIFALGLVIGYALESNKDRTIGDIAGVVVKTSAMAKRRFRETRFAK